MLIQTTTDITSALYQKILSLRKEVFVKEKNVPANLELENEQGPIYYGGVIDDTVVCCARVIEEDNKTWHIQRVATKKPFRGQGLNSQLFKKIEQDAKNNGIDRLILGAQDQAQGFYLHLGFKVVGDAFIDAGITHHMMEKKI
ncbi:GNAT family N-acetyltransferase [Lactobacillus jensenii]|uniref:GNAT family N-acetyltransferase n=1 Tax=Lactobacillus jensenii TaxID=109790 RepID=UPI002870646A|nr:GNAT family N-acetyltransferase [Lactobacillus jensenii]